MIDCLNSAARQVNTTYQISIVWYIILKMTVFKLLLNSLRHQLRIRGVFELHFGFENFILDFCFFQPLLYLLMKDVTLSEGKYLIAEYVWDEC